MQYSKSELKEVEVINFTMAKNNGVPVNLLRKTTIAENVEQLKLVAKDILNMSKQQKRKGNIDSRKTSLTQAGSNMQ